MCKRMMGVIAMLCLLVASLVVIPPPAAQAITSPVWKTTVSNVYASSLYAYDSSGIVVAACNPSNTNDYGAVYVDSAGTVRSTTPKPGAAANQSHCTTSYGVEDGTVYGWTQSGTSSSQLVAWKNGRQLWATSTTSTVNCVTDNSYVDKVVTPSSISQGPDGMLYMILSPAVSSQVCDDFLAQVNPATGAFGFTTSIGHGASSSSRPVPVTAWTYQDAVVVVDQQARVREFSYAGVEATQRVYSLPVPPSQTINKLASTNGGTIFALTRPDMKNDPSVLLYHKRDGSNGSIVNQGTGLLYGSFQPTSDGSAVVIGGYGSRIDRFDLASGTVVTTSPSAALSGYSGSTLTGYVEDASGNQLLMWEHWSNSSSNTAVSVELLNAAAATASRVFVKEFHPNDLAQFPEFYNWSGLNVRAVSPGLLYLAVCQHTASECYSFGNTPTMDIYKIDVAPFGTPVGKGLKRNTYTSQKLKYVAMGDSFSSGEGNEPFVMGTDLNGTNQCHRSQDAYPMLLEKDTSLNLDMTAFVACSGATTDNILTGGQWGEPRQLDALSSETDVVTLTIGGNDVGFNQVLEACAHSVASSGWGCKNDSALNVELTARLGALDGTNTIQGIHAIGAILDAISVKTENKARVYIAGYPHLFGTAKVNYNTNASAPGGAACLVGAEGITFSYEDALWMNSYADSVNQAIVKAVNDASARGLKAAYVPSNFSGNGWCDSDNVNLIPITLDAYQPVKSNPGSMHPNYQGILEGYTIPFEMFMEVAE